MRPWLASQVLRGASDAKRGLDRATAPEAVFRRRAEDLGLPVRAEFPSAEDMVTLFGQLPAEAEVELLCLELDGIETSTGAELARAEAWLRGDLAGEEELALKMNRDYTALYEHLVVARNRGWLSRINTMLEQRTKAFIVIGLGHMVGTGSVVRLLAEAGISVTPI